MKQYVYVDYENMGGLKRFPKINGKYFFFIGASQKSIPTSLLPVIHENEVKFVEIGGSGKNALDFHIAYYLAKNDGAQDVTHYVLSKDKGFDPLISFINKEKGREAVKRVAGLDGVSGIEPKHGRSEGNKTDSAVSNVKEKYGKAIKNIRGIDKGKRPKSEKALEAHIKTFSQSEQWSDGDIEGVIREMYRNKVISKGSNNRITYSL